MGFARVVGSNPLKETVVVELETQVTVELPVADVKVVNRPMINRPEPIVNNQEIKEPKENIVPPDAKPAA
jgi:hypothetical protein